MIHSLIGGTGGGLGCCILESVKDEFPEIHITSVTTSPFVSGESPMQHYNALFTLAWLQRFAISFYFFRYFSPALLAMLGLISGAFVLSQISY